MNLRGVYLGGKPYKGHAVTLEVVATFTRGIVVLFSTFCSTGANTGSTFRTLLSLSLVPSSEDEEALDILDTIVPLRNCMRGMGLWLWFYNTLFLSLSSPRHANLFSVIFCRGQQMKIDRVRFLISIQGVEATPLSEFSRQSACVNTKE